MLQTFIELTRDTTGLIDTITFAIAIALFIALEFGVYQLVLSVIKGAFPIKIKRRMLVFLFFAAISVTLSLLTILASLILMLTTQALPLTALNALIVSIVVSIMPVERAFLQEYFISSLRSSGTILLDAEDTRVILSVISDLESHPTDRLSTARIENLRPRLTYLRQRIEWLRSTQDALVQVIITGAWIVPTLISIIILGGTVLIALNN
ncbi:MAG: hypothetical protein GYB68_03580 [Chloroflexi bacterium]|nr:hypothetical protein [Chloroflexota bacterium]